MKKVLIFGSKGLLGSALTEAFAGRYEVIAARHGDIDITDDGAVEAYVSAVRPDIVINAAGYVRVEEADANPHLAYAANALGAYAVARAAARAGAAVIFPSTDYVFDGSQENGFAETDTPKPLNIYGASKEAGETLVRIGNPKHWILRASALFGPGVTSRPNFVLRMRELAAKGDVRVVADQSTVPTYTVDFAAGVLSTLEKEVPFGTYHLVNEGNATWQEFASTVFELSNLTAKAVPISTEESGTKIVRPAHSVLRNTLLAQHGITLPEWKDALSRYIKTL